MTITMHYLNMLNHFCNRDLRNKDFINQASMDENFLQKIIRKGMEIIMMYSWGNKIISCWKISCHGAILNNIDIESATWIGFTQSPLKPKNKHKIMIPTSLEWKVMLGATSRRRFSFSLGQLKPLMRTLTPIIWVPFR